MFFAIANPNEKSFMDQKTWNKYENPSKKKTILRN